MPDPIPPKLPPYVAGGYWYRPPFTPRYTIPQSFGEALSYEAQIHWIAALANDAAEAVANVSFFRCAYGDATLDTSAFERWHVFDYSPAVLREGEVVRPGDAVALVVPDYDAAYKGRSMVVLAHALAWAPGCQRLTAVWYATLHDPTGWLDDIEGDIDLLDNRVSSLEQRVAGNEDAISGLRTDVDNLDARVSNLTTEVENIDASVTNLETKVENIQGGATSEQLDAVKAAVTAIVNKVNAGGEINWETGEIRWGSGLSIPTGSLNVYAAAGDPSVAGNTSSAIKSHANVEDGDVWFKLG